MFDFVSRPILSTQWDNLSTDFSGKWMNYVEKFSAFCVQYCGCICMIISTKAHNIINETVSKGQMILPLTRLLLKFKDVG